MIEDATPEKNEPISSEAWNGYLNKMTKKARWALRNVKRSIGDHDDAVVSAVRTYLRRHELEDPQMEEDPEDIWPLLQYHLVRKIDKYRKQPLAKKNQGIRMGDLRTDEGIANWKDSFVEMSLSPEEIEEYIEAAMRLLDDLIEDEELRRIASLALQGYTHQEISDLTPGLSVSAVGRRVAMIRALLRKSEDSQGDQDE